MARFWRCILAVGLILAFVTVAAAQDGPRVVAVNQVLRDIAERLLEDDAKVVFPVPVGVDPSFWRPSIADISMVQSADLILLNGAGFAAWIDRVSLPRSRIVNTTATIEDQFIVTKSITHSHGEGGEHSHEGLASYTWLDPNLAVAQAEAIASTLIARDLAAESDVSARLKSLRSELIGLDEKTTAALSDAKGVAMIATHPRYQYFARRYSLSITSVEWEAGEMPSDDQLTELSGLAKELGAQVLIWEARPPREAIVAAEALGLQSVVFEPWAARGSYESFFEAYETAVAGIADAARLSSN